ncbi:MAG: AAA family ATPase [Candidatus Sericytochromatia bacterium]|nr:AAA family ATPase [Candidatus Sericytochromatia bacterium]
MITKIVYLEIKHFKSLEHVRLEGLSCFSVFAGPNGAGKSNLFEAMRFIGLVARQGVQAAIDASGGIQNIRCKVNNSDTMGFKIRFVVEQDIEGQGLRELHYAYHLNLYNLDGEKIEIEEQLESPRLNQIQNSTVVPESPSAWVQAYRDRGKDSVHFSPEPNKHEVVSLSQDKSILLISPYTSLPATILSNIYRFMLSPQQGRLPYPETKARQILKEDGSNLALVISQHVNSGHNLNELIDWLKLVVPGGTSLISQLNLLDHQFYLLLKEQYLKDPVPAQLLSDGTINLLSLLMSIYSVPTYGWSLIEEPENGLHPKATQELVAFFRSQAHENHPVWLTTHDTHLINQLKPEELWLVDKIEGKTRFVAARDLDLKDIDLSMSEVWLSNAFGAGLPW